MRYAADSSYHLKVAAQALSTVAHKAGNPRAKRLSELTRALHRETRKLERELAP